jgi:hypothetical protein
MVPLWLGFPSGDGDAEAMALQRNNFSQLLPFSGGNLLRHQLVMMLLTLLISRKMLFGGNMMSHPDLRANPNA